MHLSVFKVHKYPDLMRLEVQVHVWGVDGVKGVLLSGESKNEWPIKMYTLAVSRKLYTFNLGNKWLTHLSLRLRNQYPLPGVTVIFPFLLTDFLATPRSQSVFPVTSTCSKPHPVFVRSLVDTHAKGMSRGSHLPVVPPRWHHLPPQHADDPVKPLLVVGQQLVLIPAPNLHKHSPLMQNLPHHLKTHSHTHRSHLTLFMSSDMISLGWAVLTSSVTSTVETRQKEETIALTLGLSLGVRTLWGGV